MFNHQWKKQAEGAVKVNVDASFHADNFSGACGAVARDDRGNFLAATTCAIPHVSSASSAELSAIRCGLILATNLGCTKLILESDCMTALEAISDPNTYMGIDLPIVAECSLMAMEFESISFTHCSREANMVADGLAKHSFSLRKSETWDAVPNFILHSYVNDLALI